ncbi:MAG: MgtC/SapB family protein [Minisyncoccia bacterium]
MNFISDIELEFSIRILVALILGVLIGIERVRSHKIAGPRTYALVSMGAALFVVTGELVHEVLNTSVDSLRIAAQIVVGIGFLGGGMIMLKNGEKTGVTTAAGLWVAAAIGVACGFGFFTLAVVATIATVLTFTLLWTVEEKYIAHHDDVK